MPELAAGSDSKKKLQVYLQREVINWMITTPSAVEWTLAKREHASNYSSGTGNLQADSEQLTYPLLEN